MTARIIDGRTIAAEVESEVRAAVVSLERRGIHPAISVLRVGSDPASEIYVRNKARKAQDLGIGGGEKVFEATISEAELLAEIEVLNRHDAVDGILVQLPLPKHIDSQRVIDSIDPAKDVDGFHPINVGKLHLGRASLIPCTPAGVLRLIEATGTTIEGRLAVVVGRSDIVGKPMAAILLQRHATVMICHSRTPDLGAITRQADILVAAVGKPLLVTADMVKPGAVVIDVGMNRVDASFGPRLAHDAGKSQALTARGTVLVGDVDFIRALEVASWITPVPGGVGPMTIAMLMKNTVTAAEWRRG